jgi:hypothetical protein
MDHVTHHPPSLPPSFCHSVIGLSAAKILFRGDTVLVKGKKGRWTREGGREGREGGREECQFSPIHARTYTLFPSLPPSLPPSFPLIGRSTVCIVLTEEAAEDSNVRMNKVRREGGKECRCRKRSSSRY